MLGDDSAPVMVPAPTFSQLGLGARRDWKTVPHGAEQGGLIGATTSQGLRSYQIRDADQGSAREFGGRSCLIYSIDGSYGSGDGDEARWVG